MHNCFNNCNTKHWQNLHPASSRYCVHNVLKGLCTNKISHTRLYKKVMNWTNQTCDRIHFTHETKILIILTQVYTDTESHNCKIGSWSSDHTFEIQQYDLMSKLYIENLSISVVNKVDKFFAKYLYVVLYVACRATWLWCITRVTDK